MSWGLRYFYDYLQLESQTMQYVIYTKRASDAMFLINKKCVF